MASSLLLPGPTPLQTRRPSRAFGSATRILAPAHFRRGINEKLQMTIVPFHGQSPRCYRLRPVYSSSSSEDAHPIVQGETFEQWDSMTAKFAGVANLPFLLLQLPQIVLNTQNLIAGNNSALLAVPWLGMLTGLLGNLCLVSYFIKKKETEAVIVQTSGVISTYVVMLQLAMGEAMPLPHFVAVSIVVASGLVLNFLKYFDLLNSEIWQFWEDFITVVGLSTLPQVMWSTFVPYVPNTILPGIIVFGSALLAVVMARMGKLSDRGVKFLGSVSGWTATLLFMWMAVAQMWTNLLNPENIKGLSAATMLLAMIGNGLLIPRALFIRDLMWYVFS
ncbi:maltose excess protein 1 chloroplastic [Phtheirospermum japonicum]|uniref:Maltose excess protein 1 chloroplastic n=1 Tax=Phtheirospermum japonicum TaxID=374723 RepID=A0A830B7X9_9LAMI|nr:maltose excess protein 1 chloroplastic [Phtheirospermum japonicum]